MPVSETLPILSASGWLTADARVKTGSEAARVVVKRDREDGLWGGDLYRRPYIHLDLYAFI